MNPITASVVSRSGRFASGPADDVAAFSESISFDWQLWSHDIQGSLAHAAMLARIGILSESERIAIQQGLMEIGREIAAGTFSWNPSLEDVHMNIESELTRRVAAGAKLHTARSRNDQVALDMRLWLRDEIGFVLQDIATLQAALVQLAGHYADLTIPGYTHLQRAQPVYVPHHLLAYVEMLARDASRFRDARERLNVCPLGSGAIAGSTLPIDREFVAIQLGFVDAHGHPRLTQNSMDAVSDRDFIVEFCSSAALSSIHLSRLSEDIILWVSSEFNFLRLSDAYTTGSSLMPQKKNPDVAELTRGKCGRVVGNLMSLLMLLKGLPMTYNRDLQEDKERLFDTAHTLRSCLRLMAGMMNHAEFKREACLSASSDPQLLATDLADHLVRHGLPFREAHHLVGAVVAYAERTGKQLNQLSKEDFHAVSPKFPADSAAVFNLALGLAQRQMVGSPGTTEVGRQLAQWRERLHLPLMPEHPPVTAP